MPFEIFASHRVHKFYFSQVFDLGCEVSLLDDEIVLVPQKFFDVFVDTEFKRFKAPVLDDQWPCVLRLSVLIVVRLILVVVTYLLLVR